MTIFRRHHMPGSTDMIDFFEYDTDIKVKYAQEKASRSTLNKLMCKHISVGDGNSVCSFTELRNTITQKCIDAENIVHSTNDFSDNLHVTINGTDFSLSMPLFPKGNENRHIDIQIRNHKLSTKISTKSLPESIVNFLVAISEWIPEYEAIEENIRTEEKKKQLACKIAYDALEKIVEDKLCGKGYAYTSKHQPQSNHATIKIRSANSISIKFEVELTENFLEDITAILDSFPACPKDLQGCTTEFGNEFDYDAFNDDWIFRDFGNII